MTEANMVLCCADQSKASEEDKDNSEFFVEERMNKKKLIYIRMLEYPFLGGHYWWIVLNPHVDDPANFYKEKGLEIHKNDPYFLSYGPGYFEDERDDYPSGFLEHKGYGLVSLDSKIYFMGGLLRSTGKPSDKIFVFDTQSNAWETQTHCMKEERAFPIVFSYGNRVYVLGRQALRGYDRLPPHRFAEFFDVDSRKSYYLSAPPEQVRQGCFRYTRAIDYAREKVFLGASEEAFFGYSFRDEEWFVVKFPRPIYCHHPMINWSEAAVVIRSILFWNHYGTIFGYDMAHDNFSDLMPVPMCHLPNASWYFRIPRGPLHFPTGFLVNVGNGTLCLVHGNESVLGEPLLWCHRFQVLYSPTLNQVQVTYQDTQSHPNKGSFVDVVLELSYTGGGANKKGKGEEEEN